VSWKREPLPTREQRLAARSRRMTAMAASVVPVDGVSMTGSTSGKAIAKQKMVQHLGYMLRVRELGFCMLCRRKQRKGQVQFCHRDQGKGIGIKTDARGGWPGCEECHHFVGTSGSLPKEQRRELEDALAVLTRAEIRVRGMWPRTLEEWPETQSVTEAAKIVNKVMERLVG
jgi:hypothetical protein